METLYEYDECYKQAAEDEYHQHMTQSLVFQYNRTVYRSGGVAYLKCSLRPIRRLCDKELLAQYFKEIQEDGVDFIFEYFYERFNRHAENNSKYFVTFRGGGEDCDTGLQEEVDYVFAPYVPCLHDKFARNRKKQK